jgi:hypothetical protein
MDVTTCLQHYPWRDLTALADVYDTSVHHRYPKSDVAAKLSQIIHEYLPEIVSSLSADARAALRALLQTDDLAIPRPDFVARFGPLHPYRPWNPKAPPGPWPEPTSPAAALVHYGLAYSLNLGTAERPIPVVLLPHDLQGAIAIALDLPPKLAGLPTRELAYSQLAHLQTCKPAHLQTDMFAFLSFLNRRDYTVTHDRWLPPRALKALNDFLDPPDDLGAGRSELQAARIPFLHYLAERAGLVGLIGGYLKPTPLSEDWLTAPAADRIRSLWEVWREHSEANRALWHRYRLPALKEDSDPLARFHALLDGLAARVPGPLGRPDDLLDALARWDPALLRPQVTYAAWDALGTEEQTAFDTDARRVLSELLTGPLLWFGIVERIDEETNERKSEASGPLRLTPLGAALLGRDDGAWPADPTPVPLRVDPLLERDEEETLNLYAPVALPLSDRFALEALAPPDPGSPGRYRLTRPRFQRALQRGHTAEGVVNFLERASDNPLPAPALGVFYRWAETFGAITIRQAVLLQTRDPAQMEDLTARRRLRETLGATLNARTIEVKAERLEALLRRLEYRGVVPYIDLPDPHPESLTGQESEAERAAIVAALQVYAHLADALGQASRPAYALIRRWREALPMALREAADHRAEDLIEALHRADPLEMEDRLPQPTGPLLEALEVAIEAGESVEIDYYTAGRVHQTTRRVDPLRLEWRGDVVYLIAYCHLRSDQRVFRVDRIERIGNGE